LTPAFKVGLSGLPVDVFCSTVKAETGKPRNAARGHGMNEHSAARFGRYHVWADNSGSTVKSLSTGSYEDGISTSQLLVEVVFPMYAGLSSGAYHRLMGRGGRVDSDASDGVSMSRTKPSA
jgi:hypothetical protein